MGRHEQSVGMDQLELALVRAKEAYQWARIGFLLAIGGLVLSAVMVLMMWSTWFS